MAKYKIKGKYKNGKTEVLDTAETEQEASYLASEYKLAYGRDWKIWVSK